MEFLEQLPRFKLHWNCVVNVLRKLLSTVCDSASHATPTLLISQRHPVQNMAAEGGSVGLRLSDIEPWSKTLLQYLALERLPQLRKARDSMSDALSEEERQKLQDLTRKRSVELCLDQEVARHLHAKVGQVHCASFFLGVVAERHRW